MLTFIGLGLYDHKDVSVRGLEYIRHADHVFLEGYTSRLEGTNESTMATYFGRPIQILGREDVEQHPELILDPAMSGDVAFLTGGDPMVSTTHADLRIRAKLRGIRTGIIHGASISSAVCGLTGLQNYRFGKSCSLPFPRKNWSPVTPVEVIGKNLSQGLHTLVYLDIQEDRCMTVPEAVTLLEDLAKRTGISIPLFVGVARAGSQDPVVCAGSAEKVCKADFGPPLHILVVPGPLHVMEQEYLELFGGL
ncbi:MAG: diphthine synthase [Methanolinea sp.]|jgi:diphthine synthase|nr:diphthine synthase [Methanolinea sp.]